MSAGGAAANRRALSLEDAWAIHADGLHIQRYFLELLPRLEEQFALNWGPHAPPLPPWSPALLERIPLALLSQLGELSEAGRAALLGLVDARATECAPIFERPLLWLKLDQCNAHSGGLRVCTERLNTGPPWISASSLREVVALLDATHLSSFVALSLSAVILAPETTAPDIVCSRSTALCTSVEPVNVASALVFAAGREWVHLIVDSYPDLARALRTADRGSHSTPVVTSLGELVGRGCTKRFLTRLLGFGPQLSQSEMLRTCRALESTTGQLDELVSGFRDRRPVIDSNVVLRDLVVTLALESERYLRNQRGTEPGTPE